MVELLKIEVRGGDLLPLGNGSLNPGGLSWTGGAIAWADIARVGAEEKKVDFNPLMGGVGAAAVGYGAAIFAGPVGIAGAAIVGGVVAATRFSEKFEVWAKDGRFASVAAKSGTMKKAREWREVAEMATHIADRRATLERLAEQPAPELKPVDVSKLSKATRYLREKLPRR